MDTEPTTEQSESRTEGLEKYYLWAKFLLIILVTAAVGMFLINQGLAFHYKAELLQTPCETCVEVNPEWKACYDYLTTPRPTSKWLELPEINLSELSVQQ